MNLKRVHALGQLGLVAGALLSISTAARSAEGDAAPYLLPEVEVEGRALKEGPDPSQEEGGFRPKSASVGVLGDRPLQDLPFSINVLNQDLLERQQVHTVNDALKYFPSVQMEARGSSDGGRPQSRGFEGGVVSNFRIDGMNAVVTTPQPVEAFSRFEVINSLTGSLYGPAEPAGTFNMVQKRPTDYYLNRVSLGLTDQGAATGHVDLGGRPSKLVGYRVNLLKQDGDNFVSGSNINRTLGALGVDLHPTDTTTLELDYSYYNYKRFGFPSGIRYTADSGLPGPVNPKKRGYGQSFGGMDNMTQTQSIKLHQDLSDNWRLNLGYLHEKAYRAENGVTNTYQGDGSIKQSIATASTAGLFRVHSYLNTLTGKFHTGSLSHDLVLGLTGYSWDIYNGTATGAPATLGGFPFDHPQRFTSRPPLSRGRLAKTSSTLVSNEIVSDTVRFNEHFSTLLSASHNRFRMEQNPGVHIERGHSYSAAFMFKPVQNLMTYVSYADTLEAGPVADSSDAEPYANEGQVLDPMRSRQIEWGLKTSWHGMDFNAAIFRIKRPMAFVDEHNTFGVQGLQENRGLELFVAGKAADHLRLTGGVTFIDPKLKKSTNPENDDKRVIGVPKTQANLLAEYDVPGVPGLSLNGNVHALSRRAGSASNTVWAAGFTTFDLGARYDLKPVYGHAVQFNLMARNITDKHYWNGLYPSSINGASGGTATIGDPRTVELKASLTF